MVVAFSAPSLYLNQRWNILNWTFGNQLHWNVNQNINIFIKENAFENVVWGITAILSQLQYVNTNPLVSHKSKLSFIKPEYMSYISQDVTERGPGGIKRSHVANMKAPRTIFVAASVFILEEMSVNKMMWHRTPKHKKICRHVKYFSFLSSETQM